MWRYFSAKNTNVYLDVLPKLMDDYNKSKQRTIKMMPTELVTKEVSVKCGLHTKMRPISINKL